VYEHDANIAILNNSSRHDAETSQLPTTDKMMIIQLETLPLSYIKSQSHGKSSICTNVEILKSEERLSDVGVPSNCKHDSRTLHINRTQKSVNTLTAPKESTVPSTATKA
jgi:hypothetical protein